MLKSKTCTKCGEERPVEQFLKRESGRAGVRPECKGCQAEYQKGYRRVIRGAIQRRYSLKKHYGITVEQYNEMFSAQSGKCAICDTHATDLPSPGILCVDHDHDTGVVRALLCGLCNKGIGIFKEDQFLLERAISYLKAHKE